jgi:hypothetical protein
MQMSSCSVLGAGLRVGATITIHNAHLIYLHGKLEGSGACIRTHCQVLNTYCNTNTVTISMLAFVTHMYCHVEEVLCLPLLYIFSQQQPFKYWCY